jgi:hypothetical protein
VRYKLGVQLGGRRHKVYAEIVWAKLLGSVKFGYGKEYQNVNILTDF